MKKIVARRPSAALVISCLALFVALGGAAYAGTQLPGNSVGTKQLKKNAVNTGKIKSEAVRAGKLSKNAVSTNRLRDNAVTGAKVNESTLSQVPSAASAVSAVSAANATNATNVDTVKTFSQGANEASMVSLVKTANFELMGICDTASTFDPPGVQFENVGTSYVIYNRSAAPAFADTEDDEDYNLTLNQGVVFNYQDNGDGGEAMSVDGHFLSAASWANMLGDTSNVNTPKAGDSYPFPTTCHFAGAALVG